MSQSPQQRTGGFGAGIGFQDLTVDATAVALTIPAGAQSALVSTDSVAVRFRVDGNDPTSTVGHKLPLDTFMEFFGEDMVNARFISNGASTSLFVTYYS